MGWIGVDFDGTLAKYDGFKGPGVTGAPIPLMVERVKRWLVTGVEVRIVTARVSGPEDSVEATRAIEAWCHEHLGQKLQVTCCKDFGMVELWDDRVVQVRTNTGIRADGRP